MCHYFFYLNSDHDTVGAVAIDSAGHLACATSTGGITAKRAGRVGDTPVIGAGGFADDFVGAVSTTGHGETIMRACLSRHITGLMQQGMHIFFSTLENCSFQIKIYNLLLLYHLNGFNLPVHYYLLKNLYAYNLNQFSQVNVFIFLNVVLVFSYRDTQKKKLCKI